MKNKKRVYKSIIKKACYFFAIMVIAVGAGVMLLWGAYSINVDLMKENAEKSARVFKEEGLHPAVIPGISSNLDNFTDSLMVLEATNANNEGALKSSMRNRTSFASEDPIITITKKYLENAEVEDNYDYYRYWHGYLIFLKPLLLFADYSGIRCLNGILQLGIIILTSVLLYKKKRKKFIFVYLLAILSITPLAIMMSIQNSSCFYIGLLFSLLILVFKKKKSFMRIVVVLLLSGMATAYFDLLTYPLITFGVPTVMYLIVYKERHYKRQSIEVVGLGLSWAIGYAVMWASKWIIGGILLGENVLGNALDNILVRTDGSAFSAKSVIVANYLEYFKNPFSMIMAIAALVMSGYIVVRLFSVRKIINKKMIAGYVCSGLPFLILAICPIVWCAVLTNHSGIHYCFFTFRIAMISTFAILSWLTIVCEKIKRASIKKL